MKAEQHIWRTADGRHVPDGDPDAAILAYPRGHDVPDDVTAELTGGTAKPVKQAPRPANKQAAKPADK